MSATAPNNWSQEGQRRVWKRETENGMEKIWISDNGSGYSVQITEGGNLVERENFCLIGDAKQYIEEYIADPSA